MESVLPISTLFILAPAKAPDDSKFNDNVELLVFGGTSKEENLPFGYVKTRSIDEICDDFIPDVVDKVEREGLKCKAIEHIVSDDEEYVYFFIYETECEDMNKQIEVLERRGSIRLLQP